MVKAVKQIAAADFQADCQRVLDEVAAGSGEYVVTRQGVPVARLVPHVPENSKPVKREPPEALEGTLLWFDRPCDPMLDPLEDDIFPPGSDPQA